MATRPYFPALDGLRALAVLAVFFHHYMAQFLPAGYRFGWVGVDVFFALSGFLITGILFDTRNDAHRWRNFYIRRTLRIFPLFYGILALLAITTPLFHWSWSWRWLSLPGYFFNMMPKAVPGHPGQTLGLLTGLIHHRTIINLVFFHFWTLCVEEQFYLLWPAIVFLVRDRRRLLHIIAVVVPAVLVLRCLAYLHAPDQVHTELLARALYARADSLMVGAAVALLLRGPAAQRVLRFGGQVLAGSLALFCVLGLIAVRYLHQPFSSEQETSWIVTVGFSCIAFASAGLLLLCLQENTLLTMALRWKPLRWLGQRSYGFYVFHLIWIQPTLVIGNKLAARLHAATGDGSPVTVVLQTAVAFVLTLAVSAGSYRWFELPLLRLKDRWTTRTVAAVPSNDTAAMATAVTPSRTE